MSSTLETYFARELEFLYKLDLRVQVFGKDLQKFFDGCKGCTIFFVVTRNNGDELRHPENLPEPDMRMLRNWIRCGNPTGMRPEWKSINCSVANVKAYLAGQDPGIDCTVVMDDMFAEEEGKKYTYAYYRGDRSGIKKIAHPHEYVPLREHYGKLWRSAEDFSDILLLNRKFLRGEIPETPYHVCPVDDETIPLVSSLLKLHEFGLITNNGQPYEHDRTIDLGKEKAEYQQRPYLSFIMQGGDQALLFFAMLRKRQEIVVQASEIHPFKVLPGSHEQVLVTRERIAKTLEDLETTSWGGLTSALSTLDISNEDFYCLDAVKRSRLLRFQVAASEWGVPLDLLCLIEEVAVECGLPRM